MAIAHDLSAGVYGRRPAFATAERAEIDRAYLRRSLSCEPDDKLLMRRNSQRQLARSAESGRTWWRGE